jgi:DNA-binding PadR family transcriptional regulator
MPRLGDRALIPAEAVRLAALGELSRGDVTLGALSMAVRGFVSRLMGPSLDVMGVSIEQLRYEGLIETVGKRAGAGQSLTAESQLTLTDKGREMLLDLLRGPVRAPMTDLSKMVVALKLRFFDLLPNEDRAAQLDQLVELAESEIARLKDLVQRGAEGLMGEWLVRDIAEAERWRDWYAEKRAALNI